MDGFVYAIDSSELKEGEGRQLIVEKQSVAVFRYEGKVHAVDGICPHAGSPLGPGFVAKGLVECPWHAWRFSLIDGTSPDVPGLTIAVFPAIETGGKVYIQIASAS
ncbi:MAG: Rieske (2Fe-2S) protein [Planctomycetota bacterium]